MKKVILTGSTGLIGKEAIKPLEEAGFEVYCLTSKNCNLFDEIAVREFFEKVKPEYLLHFAWDTTQGYLEANSNFDFLKASLNMLEVFKENGGKRAVFAGTCFEYEFKDELIKESDNLNPTSVYAKCKNSLRELSELYCNKNNISFGWGRIFYVYGHGENLNRLTPYIINSLRENKPVEIKCGQLIKDYMYSKDIAEAFVKFLFSDVQGAVNICTGKGISLKDYGLMIAEILQKTEFLIVKHETTNQPPIIAGDKNRLVNEVKYSPNYDIKNSLKKIIDEC